MMAVLDVWSGEMHMDHVARYIVEIEGCHEQVVSEVKAGFLVNLRGEVAWGEEQCFDDRVAQ